MSVQKVMVCDGFGCRTTSKPHKEDALFMIHFEQLVEGWGRMDLSLGEGPMRNIVDICPRCCAEFLFEWIYVAVYGNSHHGCSLEIRPEGYSEWWPTYNAADWRFKAGRELPYTKVGYSEDGQDGSHIVPSFIFDHKRLMMKSIQAQVMSADEVREQLSIRPGEVQD